jgi:sugar O-acyltransferase (sialic acid O-acetyltransferase NeuD family)
MGRRLAIIGASTLGRQIAHQASLADASFEVVGFFDDFAAVGGDVLGPVEIVQEEYDAGAFDCLAIGVGYNAMEFRASCAERFSGRIPLARIVSTGAFVDPSARIEEGAVVLTGTMIDQNVTIGANCFLSLGCSISHDTAVGSNSYFGPRATICGRCRVGSRCFLGAGCVVREDIRIADGVTVGAGAVVVKSITAPGVYVGAPARVLTPCSRKSHSRNEVEK